MINVGHQGLFFALGWSFKLRIASSKVRMWLSKLRAKLVVSFDKNVELSKLEAGLGFSFDK